MAVAAAEYDEGGDAGGLRRPPQTWARDDGSTVNQRRFRILETLGRGGFVSIIINLIILLMINTASAKAWFTQNI